MVALILAAGYATRLYPYTINTAKPLLPVGDKPLIDYIIRQVESLDGIEKILVVTNDKFFNQFEQWKLSKKDSCIKIINDGTSSVEERLGAIGDISFAIHKEGVDDELVIIAGDNLFTYNLREQYKFFKEHGDCCVCVKELSDINALKSVGVCQLDKTGKVIGFEEKPENPKSNIAVYATYMLKKGGLRFIDEYLSTADKKDAPGHFIEWLHRRTDVYAYIINGECYDIGTVEAYESIQSDTGIISALQAVWY